MTDETPRGRAPARKSRERKGENNIQFQVYTSQSTLDSLDHLTRRLGYGSRAEMIRHLLMRFVKANKKWLPKEMKPAEMVEPVLEFRHGQ